MSRFRSFGWVLRFATVLLAAQQTGSLPLQAALVIQDYTPEQHDRFANHPSFIGASYDWSGVGTTTANNARWGTLISPSFILSVNHFAAGGSVRFYTTNDPDGPFEVRTVVQNFVISKDGQSGTPLPSDIRLSRLSAPVTNATTYSVLNLPNAADYVDQTIYTFGKSNATGAISQRLGRNQVEAIVDNVEVSANGIDYLGDVLLFDYDNPGGVGADESWVQSGDSGAPSFVIVNGQPVLVGLHWFQYASNDFGGLYGFGSGDSFISPFIDEINAAMAGTGSAERLSVITVVPEPGSGLILLCAAALVASRTRLRRR